jgi:hypothetical protein
MGVGAITPNAQAELDVASSLRQMVVVKVTLGGAELVVGPEHHGARYGRDDDQRQPGKREQPAPRRPEKGRSARQQRERV